MARLLDTASKFALFLVSVLKGEKLIKKSKPTRKLKHANSILESFEYFCQMSSKSIQIILSYIVSKLTHFFETQRRQRESVYVTSALNTLSTIHGHRYIGGSSTTHSRLTPLPKELMYLIFLETRIIHLHFPTDSLCLSSFNFFWWAPQLPARLFYF